MFYIRIFIDYIRSVFCSKFKFDKTVIEKYYSIFLTVFAIVTRFPFKFFKLQSAVTLVNCMKNIFDIAYVRD